MAVWVAVTVVSAAGWLISLGCPRSAARRHLVLCATLAACLLVPIAWSVRSGTNWTVVTLRSSAAASRTAVREVQSPQPDHARARATASPAGMDHGQPAPSAAEVPRAGDEAAVDKPLNQSLLDLPAAGAAPATGPRTPPVAVARRALDWRTWMARSAALIYVAVAAAMILRLCAGLVAVWRIKHRAARVDSFAGIPVFEADVAVPLAVGFGRAAIFLPRGFRQWVASEDLADVLAHEAQHLRRRDHVVMLAQAVAAALYWPLVTVHLVNRALARAREELCDNAVLTGRDPAAYGRTLLSIAEQARRRPTCAALVAPTVLRRGELEHRVAGLLDPRRDRRTRVSRLVRWGVAATLLASLGLAGTTRVVAVGDEPQASDPVADEAAGQPPVPNDDIEWTGIPKVDPQQPALHRGVVLAPDGKPLAGASIYAASTIELFYLADADKVGVKDLGPVRGVTDAEGRFEFTAEDLTSITPAGKRLRWETLLVAAKEGIAPGWLRTWGEDRSFRSHSHPHVSRDVAIHTRPPATLSGRLLLEGGQPLAGAHVRLTALMAPRDYDLDRHIQKIESMAPGLFIDQSINYAETLGRPWIIPGRTTLATADADGRFELPGLPEGFLAEIEVTHPEAATTTLPVAIRPIEPVYRGPSTAGGERTLALYGSGFTAELPPGMVLRGHVKSGAWGKQKAAGVTVALANQNAPNGMGGQRFTTDAEGRFEVTGLRNHPGGFDLAFAGSFSAPYGSRRQRVAPGEDADVTLEPAVPYRLKLTDPQGHPTDREVYSVVVQGTAGGRHSGLKLRFDEAERVAAGVYEGIVPIGAGAVLVERGKKTDRPVAVDPKAFFAPGRTDWTREEERYAYGDAWRIAEAGISGSHPTQDQLELAAVVFTKEQTNEGVLELAATVYSDPPVQVTLVDEAGDPVEGARLERQMKRYNAKDLPATFAMYGLHPVRAESLRFTHEERGLIGALSTTWTGAPMRVVMQPAATLVGRFVKKSGALDFDFGVRVEGEGVMPDTFVAGRMFNLTDKPGEGKAEFRLMVPPGEDVHAEFVRKLGWLTRPAVGTAFSLTPQPGETIYLGDIAVP